MNILATQYTLAHKALEIYIAGCSGRPHCEGCQNPETWDFNQGEKYTKSYFQKILDKISEFDNLIENIMIFGGEPFDQDLDELFEFIADIETTRKKIWVFTRYPFEDLLEVLGDKIQKIDYLKCGRYLKELETDDNIQYGIKLATKNQVIFSKGVDY